MKAFYVALVIACMIATACSIPTEVRRAQQCEAAKREVAALRLCTQDGFCERTPDFYRDVVRSVGKMKQNCPNGDVLAAAAAAE